MSQKKYCVLHAPTTVGGNPQGLSISLRQLGICSRSLTFQQNYFNYPADYVLWSSNTSFLVKEIKRLVCILFIASRYDIIHYNFGMTIANPFCSSSPEEHRVRQLLKHIYSFYRYYLNLFELNFYVILGKKLFVTYQGDDARQGDYCLQKFKISIADQVDENYYSKESDKFKRNMITILDKFCYKIYSVNPDLLHVLPKDTQFIPYSHISLRDWSPCYTQTHISPLRICHAPSHRKVKGTDIILEICDRLKIQGYKFDLILIEGKSHSEARKIYETVDIIIDQIFGGWYGGLAVEAMALGKPVIVYIREEDLQFIPQEMAEDLPFIRADPQNLEQVLIKVLTMPRQDLLSIAQKSRDFVEKWHDPLKIAEQIKRDYETALTNREDKRKNIFNYVRD